MEYRYVGQSDLKISAIGLGTATFGGADPIFKAWGDTDLPQARRLVDIALDAGVTLFDTADVYSKGLAEEILGKTIQKRRDRMVIATKAGFRMGADPGDIGASEKYLIKACEASLKRLGIETIDLWQLHGFDMLTPLDDTLQAIDKLVRAGKVRYVGCSNHSGWQLMKALAMAEASGRPKYTAHQVHYSLLGREAEWELIPLAMDQKVSTIVWSPLSAGMLTGKIGRDQGAPEGSRIASLGARGSSLPEEQFFQLIDLLRSIAAQRQRPVSQIALNWLLHRPTVASVVIGARHEAQLLENIPASDFSLSEQEIAALDKASARPAAYPYWHQQSVYRERNPPLF